MAEVLSLNAHLRPHGLEHVLLVIGSSEEGKTSGPNVAQVVRFLSERSVPAAVYDGAKLGVEREATVAALVAYFPDKEFVASSRDGQLVPGEHLETLVDQLAETFGVEAWSDEYSSILTSSFVVGGVSGSTMTIAPAETPRMAIQQLLGVGGRYAMDSEHALIFPAPGNAVDLANLDGPDYGDAFVTLVRAGARRSIMVGAPEDMEYLVALHLLPAATPSLFFGPENNVQSAAQAVQDILLTGPQVAYSEEIGYEYTLDQSGFAGTDPSRLPSSSDFEAWAAMRTLVDASSTLLASAPEDFLARSAEAVNVPLSLSSAIRDFEQTGGPAQTGGRAGVLPTTEIAEIPTSKVHDIAEAIGILLLPLEGPKAKQPSLLKRLGLTPAFMLLKSALFLAASAVFLSDALGIMPMFGEEPDGWGRAISVFVGLIFLYSAVSNFRNRKAGATARELLAQAQRDGVYQYETPDKANHGPSNYGPSSGDDTPGLIKF